MPQANNDDVRIYRSLLKFEPNDSVINAVTLGTEIKFTYSYENFFVQRFEVTVIYVRDDLN